VIAAALHLDGDLLLSRGCGPASGAWMLEVMDLAGRLAQHHAQELKEVLRVPGDQAKQARTQLQALVEALHHILSITSEEEGRGSDGAMAVEEEGEQRSVEGGELCCCGAVQMS
jgi:hypothetical protein